MFDERSLILFFSTAIARCHYHSLSFPFCRDQSCFAPGLLAMGARVFGRMQDMAVARGLMETCYLSYRNSATGLGADEIAFLGTELSQGKEFEMPHPSGFYVIDPEYGLRPGKISGYGAVPFDRTLKTGHA